MKGSNGIQAIGLTDLADFSAQGAAAVQSCRGMDIDVGADPAGDPSCIVVIVIPSFAIRGGTAPSGTMDRTAMGLCGSLL